MPKLLLLGYDPSQPSFRHRMQSLVEPLHSAGWDLRIEQFPSGRYGLRTWERRALLRWADVAILHQIKLSALEARLFAAFSRRRVFDIDDAIYVRKPRRLGEPADESRLRRAKFEATCRWADAVAAGNAVLAAAAGAASREVVILPTSIDAASYRAVRVEAAPLPTIVWIGSPENLVYLDMIRPALARVAARHPAMRLRVVCSRFPPWHDVPIEPVPWSSATEIASLLSAHIGIMPLSDDEWTRGKCAFKLLQYMAAALPCVASPIGANAEAVIDGVTGYHASDQDGWERALNLLIESPTRRAQFGAAGHAHVDQRYALRAYRARYAALLARLAAR
jgi:glycosyltransferase involved in cell wall biosynthesis